MGAFFDLLEDLRVMGLGALRTNGVSEIQVRPVADIVFGLRPVALFIPDAFAVRANWQQ